MDVILETLDYLCLDRVYANVFPATPGPYNLGMNNMTRLASSFKYEPATKYMYMEPSDYAYMSSLSRDNIYRQTLSLYMITWLFGMLVYFVFASLSYIFIFDHNTFKHPKYLKNQVKLEIETTMWSLPVMAVFTVPFFVAEVRGYSKMYDSTSDGPGMWYDILQFPWFIFFTDACIYWIHRGLHHPAIYKYVHKPHHKWIVPTPYASHAFHPLDGFTQSIPYHIFPFLFPLNKFAYVLLFVFVNIWTVLIHDGEYMTMSEVINGAACHTGHHLYFNVNYGQYTTLWDRLCGSYRKPNWELFVREEKMGQRELARQTKEAEAMIAEVEGSDSGREYLSESKDKPLSAKKVD